MMVVDNVRGHNCYDFHPTRVDHIFLSLTHGHVMMNMTLAATCAEGSLFISALLLT